MYKVVVKLRDCEVVWQMFFDTCGGAEAAALDLLMNEEQLRPGRISHDPVTVADSYGHRMTISRIEVQAVLVIDLAGAAKASGQEAMIVAREQASVNTRAAHDPALRLHQRPGSGLIA